MQSPFLLNGTLDSHFRNYTKEPPEIVEAIKDIYVDDVEGENTTAEAKELKETATHRNPRRCEISTTQVALKCTRARTK